MSSTWPLSACPSAWEEAARVRCRAITKLLLGTSMPDGKTISLPALTWKWRRAAAQSPVYTVITALFTGMWGREEENWDVLSSGGGFFFFKVCLCMRMLYSRGGSADGWWITWQRSQRRVREAKKKKTSQRRLGSERERVQIWICYASWEMRRSASGGK